jgi:eukaryotic-like serine/threonine-protein kinase
MNSERWRRIEELHHSAAARPPEAREAFLDGACGQDVELRREVELLLQHGEQTGSLLETLRLGAPETSWLGRQFGSYRILSPLGVGGMGEVYRAHDSKLGRDVAIKTLPQAFADHRERLARFRREARTLASLNHPNIASIYGLEESGGVTCLVLELVEGETLRGPLPLEQALDYACQISEALEAAHEKGIVHCDLKPANVRVTPEGRVKVLDFGLAKAVWGTDQSNDLSQLTTLTALETAPGQVAGTPPYMSPEQARGQEVDKRTDIWAFGCLLYELLSGKRAFQGGTLPDTIAAVLERAPDWDALPAKTPARVRDLLQRCLQKDVTRRLAEIKDARGLIEVARRKRNPWPLAAAAAVAVAVLAIGATLWLRGSAQPPSRDQWIQLTKLPDAVSEPALSPDGRMLAFIRGPGTIYGPVGPCQVYVKILPAGEPVQLTNDTLLKMSPVFSPDGARIAYTTANNQLQFDTWTVPVLGGEPRLWLRNASGLVWTDPHQVLFSEIKKSPHMGIVAADENRIEQRDVYLPAHERGMAHRSYSSPDGESVLVVEMDKNGAWLPCRLVSMDGGSPGRQIGPPGAGCTFAAWSPDGKWMYGTSSAGGTKHIWR